MDCEETRVDVREHSQMTKTFKRKVFVDENNFKLKIVRNKDKTFT